MNATAIVLLVIAIALVPVAGVFAALDAALQRLSKARVDELRRDGVAHAGALVDVMAERSRHVALLLLLRIVCETAAAVLVAAVFFRLFDGIAPGVVAAAAVMTVVSYVLIGVGPRTLGRQHAYGIALSAAPLIRLLGRV